MPLLDELSGYEFEDVMVDVFRRLGYENVEKAQVTADKGRDVVMTEPDGAGGDRAVIVECKHTDVVSRPVVQKLHSAVATYAFDGEKRGMVATTGRFTAPAEEYAEEVGDAGGHPVELLDGERLREIGEEIGMDLYNGRIELLPDRALAPPADPATAGRELTAAFDRVEAAPRVGPDRADLVHRLEPFVLATTHTAATFETSVGVIHRVDERDRTALWGGRARRESADPETTAFVREHRRRTVPTERAESALAGVDRGRFAGTERELREELAEAAAARHAATVSYTGDNNVTYTRSCEPSVGDVSVTEFAALYVPRSVATATLGEYDYELATLHAGPETRVERNTVEACRRCDREGPYAYCAECGGVFCPTHTRSDRYTGEPVCADCAISARFFLAEKQFATEETLAAFRAEYEAMSWPERARENPPLAVGLVVAGLLAALLALALVGSLLVGALAL